MDARVQGVAHLFVLFVLVAGQAGAAGPRDHPELADAEAMAVETPDLAVWMQRLQGRFVLDGVIHHEEGLEEEGEQCNGHEQPLPELYSCQGEWILPIGEGKADCTGFADGPGIQCVIHVDWESSTFEDPAFVESTRDAAGLVLKRGMKDGMGNFSNLKPAMILVGLMPSSPGTIRFLLVDDHGTAYPGALTLRGNTVIAKPPCMNLPGKTACEQYFTLEAKPEAKVIFLTYRINTEFVRPKRTPFPDLLNPKARKIERGSESLEISLSLRREPDAAQDPEARLPTAK